MRIPTRLQGVEVEAKMLKYHKIIRLKNTSSDGSKFLLFFWLAMRKISCNSKGQEEERLHECNSHKFIQLSLIATGEVMWNLKYLATAFTLIDSMHTFLRRCSAALGTSAATSY